MEHLSLIEVAYNNNFQSSIEMAFMKHSIGGLVGLLCMCWMEFGEAHLLGPELVWVATDKIQVIRGKLLVAQSRKKSYVDDKIRPIEFQVGIMCYYR